MRHRATAQSTAMAFASGRRWTCATTAAARFIQRAMRFGPRSPTLNHCLRLSVTPEEMLKVRAKFPVSQDVALRSLSLSGTAVPKTSGVNPGPCGPDPELKPPAQGTFSNEPARPVRQRKTPKAGREGKRAFVQELQNADRQKPAGHTAGETFDDHQAGTPTTYGGDYGKFRVAITFLMPDRRRKDIDGMCSTILDCLIRARRRLLDPHPRTAPVRSAGRARGVRRRTDQYHPPVGSKVPF